MLTKNEFTYLIKPFEWQDWLSLWQLRKYQLAEAMIAIEDALPPKPDLNSPYEKDYHRMAQVYLAEKGNFWLAWVGGSLAGHVGIEDRGDYGELRRMYVRVEFRRRGIGTLLVQTLINHCIEKKVDIVELWTADEGPGRFLYEQFGFRQVEITDKALGCKPDDNDQIRMRLAVTDLSIARDYMA